VKIKYKRLRDRFWRAFWLRHQKYLPPTHHVSIERVTAYVDKNSKVPAIHVECGREWAE
jgi:hypothetical protein